MDILLERLEEIDGGIDYKRSKKQCEEQTNTYMASKAGANIFVAGTSIFREKVYKTPIAKIRKLANSAKQN